LGSILVIEDDAVMASIVRRVLAMADMTSTLAATGREGLATAARIRPDAILLDLDLPDANGLDLIPDLRAVAPVIVLTARATDDTVVRALDRGADDFVNKPFSPRVLIARIRAAIRRSSGTRHGHIECGPLDIDLDRRCVSLAGRPLDLTRRELDLLAHLAQHEGAVVTREELLSAVWQSTSEWQAPSTVTEHVRRVRIKLGDPRWIESVRGIGYRFTVPAA
jgi:DNA-binding response OmpR family regulator